MTNPTSTSTSLASVPSAYSESFLPVPLAYFALMPSLSESEWRVLLVILRQTLGWIDPASPTGRKERDWITQSQFREKTGKSRDSISLAVASLVNQGLISVEDRAGGPLSTPKSRQNNRDRLYFRLLPLEERGQLEERP